MTQCSLNVVQLEVNNRSSTGLYNKLKLGYSHPFTNYLSTFSFSSNYGRPTSLVTGDFCELKFLVSSRPFLIGKNMFY